MTRYKTVGTGITAKQVVVINHDDYHNEKSYQKDLHELLQKRKISTQLQVIKAHAMNVLTKAGLPHRYSMAWPASNRFDLADYVLRIKRPRSAPDSDEGYAARILTRIENLQTAKKKSETSELAFWIGALWTEWQFKTNVEIEVLRDRKKTEAGKANLEKQGDRKRSQANEKWAPIQTAAAKMFEQKPGLSTRSVAKFLKNKFKINAHIGTICDQISKVRRRK